MSESNQGAQGRKMRLARCLHSKIIMRSIPKTCRRTWRPGAPTLNGWRSISTTCAVLLLVVAGCGDETRTLVKPAVTCADCSHDAVMPGTDLRFHVAWQAHCTTQGPLPDTSTTKACDLQPFTARVTCAGGPCEFDPAGADAGIDLSGEGSIVVRPTAPGDLTISVDLTNRSNAATFTTSTALGVRVPERLVVDCWYDSDPKGRNCIDKGSYRECPTPSWVPCSPTGKLEVEGGNPVSIWIYGQAADRIVFLTPVVTFEGFATDHHDQSYVPPHTNPMARGDADAWSTRLTTPGAFVALASFGALTAESRFELR
jgi:hypothetical protein